MRRQFNPNTGRRGIQWTDYTANPVAGCRYGCRWEMPDGTVAECYAKTVAEGVARSAYPDGFEGHYWRPNILDRKLPRKASMIFVDSMSDLFGPWVPDDQVIRVLEWMAKYPQHVFQSLTKTPGRLSKFMDQFPANLWVGISSPPDFMKGNRLSLVSQEAFLAKGLQVLADIHQRRPEIITWVSFEPLSWDVHPVLELHLYRSVIDWAVIGAASRGRQYYQPEPGHVRKLLAVLDSLAVPVFFKGNLDWPGRRREDFPPGWGTEWHEAVLNRERLARRQGWPWNRKLKWVHLDADPILARL